MGIVSVLVFLLLFLSIIAGFLLLGSTSASLFVHFYVNSCHKRKKNYLFPSLNSFSITCRKNDSGFLNTFVSLFKKIFINSWQKCIHISGSFHRAVVRSLFVQTSKINHCNFTKDIPTTLCICVVILLLFKEPFWLHKVSSRASVFMQLSLYVRAKLSHVIIWCSSFGPNTTGREE